MQRKTPELKRADYLLKLAKEKAKQQMQEKTSDSIGSQKSKPPQK